MDTQQIKETLHDIFDKEKHRIVFWHDGEREFAETLPGLGMDDVNVLQLDEHSPLEKLKFSRCLGDGKFYENSFC